MIAHECPSCKWKLAYVGFTAVECANTKCAFYNERWYQECADAWMAGKFDWPGYGVRTPGVVTKLELELLPQPKATPEIWTPDGGLTDWIPDPSDGSFFGLNRNSGPLSLSSLDAVLKKHYTQERINSLFLPTPRIIYVHPDTYNEMVTDLESLFDERDAS